MPTNVTPEYIKAEEEYRYAKTGKEKLKALEKMLSTVPKHKGTEKLQMQIKRKIAKLREDMEKRGKRGGPSFNIKKEGAAQVSIIGFPNSGKSTLLKVLTKVEVEIGDYEFTTKSPTPGMMEYKDVQIQLVEIPAIIEGVSSGKGLGGKILSALRVSDATVVVLDLSFNPIYQMETILKELEQSNIKLNKKKKDIEIKKLSSGGIEVRGEKHFSGDISDLKEVLMEERIHNALVVFREEATLDDFLDVLNEASAFLKCLIVANKKDLEGAEKNFEKLKNVYKNFEILLVSAKNKENLELVKEKIFQMLEIIRVFTKSHGEVAYPPLPMKKNSTVLEVANAIHKQIYKNFKYAKVWGNSVKFDGARVGGDHILKDGDIVEIFAR